MLLPIRALRESVLALLSVQQMLPSVIHLVWYPVRVRRSSFSRGTVSPLLQWARPDNSQQCEVQIAVIQIYHLLVQARPNIHMTNEVELYVKRLEGFWTSRGGLKGIKLHAQEHPILYRG